MSGGGGGAVAAGGVGAGPEKGVGQGFVIQEAERLEFLNLIEVKAAYSIRYVYGYMGIWVYGYIGP